MTITPETPTPLYARSSADVDETFAIYDDEAATVAADLTGWSFRFVVKRTRLDASRLLDVSGAVSGGTGITVTDNEVRVRIEKAQLLTALGETEKLNGLYELQALHIDGRDAVWAEGGFYLVRGL